MHDLRTARSATDFTEATQSRAARETLLLRAGEMKEAQRQRAGAIADPAQQLATAAKCDFAQQHLAFDDCALTDAQRADRHDARAVFVTQRQQEQQVLHGRDVEPGEFLGERFADAAQRRDGAQLRRLSGRALRRRCGHSNSTTQSISTRAPFGSPATATVTRAGYGSLKYSAITLLSVGKSAKSRMYTVTFVTCAKLPPAAPTIACRLSNTRRTCTSIEPCTSSAVAGSSGICPEQYTVLPTLTAWE